MPTIIEDVIADGKFTYTEKGGTLLRTFVVKNLDPSMGVSGMLVQAAAAADETNNLRIPAYAEPHPTVAGLFASQIDSKPLGKDFKTAAKVTVTYVSPQIHPASGVQVSGSTTTALVPWDKDKNGNPILVRYTDKTSGKVVSNVVKLQVPRPRSCLEFTRIVRSCPLINAKQFVGKTNDGLWQGGAAGTWICRGYEFQLLGSVVGTIGSLGTLKSSWSEHFTAEYDEDGHTQRYAYQDPTTKFIPTDEKASPNNDHGIYTYDPDSADFNSLNFPDVTTL